MSNNSNTLVDEKLAISLFLDSLLSETELVPEQEVPETKPVIEKVDIVVSVETQVEMKKEAIDVKVDEDLKVHEPVAIETETKLESTVEIENESIIPSWANEPFQILLFEVAGLKLAVPLGELSGVIEWNESVTEMPGHADFYMGILQHLGHKIAVIDTARMVLPTNKLSELAGDDPRDRVNHIVLIDDYQWGLACDNIGEVITLQPNEVRWRTSKSTRGWLAGTVIEHMCALLNSEGFSAMLKEGQEATK